VDANLPYFSKGFSQPDIFSLKVELESLHKLTFYPFAVIDEKNEPISAREIM